MYIQENYIVHNNTAILGHVKCEIKHKLQKFRLVLYSCKTADTLT